MAGRRGAGRGAGCERFEVVFPKGERGDAVLQRLRARLDLDGLEALVIAKGRLETAGLAADAVLGVLDAQGARPAIELGIERLGGRFGGGWHALLACDRTARRIWIVGVERGAGMRMALERAAREAFDLPHAPIDWIS